MNSKQEYLQSNRYNNDYSNSNHGLMYSKRGFIFGRNSQNYKQSMCL